MDYTYKARDKQGKSVTGTMSGMDTGSVAKHLSAMGYIPISIEEAMGSAVPRLALGGKKVDLADLSLFTRQLLTLQKAGIPLLSSLAVLEKQTKGKYLKDVIKDIAASIEGGSSLSGAMAKYPQVFSELYINMVKAGEASGLMDEILGRLAEFEEKEIETNSKIKSATRYPIMVIGALCLAFTIIVTFVLPKFATLFSQFKTELPLPTRMLLGLNAFIKHYWLPLLIAMAAAAIAFTRYINTRIGRLRWDAFKLRMPVFGALITMLVMSRFTRILSILIRSGLPILQVIEMASHTAGNAFISNALDRIGVSLREGKGMSEPMAMSGIFPPIVVQMVAIGEESGKLDELLLKVSEYYDQQSDYMIKNLSTLIEPILILVLGVMVLIMALAIFLPMWNMTNLIRR